MKNRLLFPGRISAFLLFLPTLFLFPAANALPLMASVVPDASSSSSASCSKGFHLNSSREYVVHIPATSDGENIAFRVYEPRTGIDCSEKHPLIIVGHGFSGDRDSYRSVARELASSGYLVIAFDQKGHKESTGFIRFMDPRYEVQNVIDILDWAESELDYIHYDDSGNMTLGSYGASYGGGFQLMLYSHDPKKRLDSMVPVVTWYDFSNSLYRNEVVKSGWLSLIVQLGMGKNTYLLDNLNWNLLTSPLGNDLSKIYGGNGDAYGQGLHPYLLAEFSRGLATNTFSDDLIEYLWKHSFANACEPMAYDISPSGVNDFDTVPPLKPLSDLYPVDAYLINGLRDALFDSAETKKMYDCLAPQGGDVRLRVIESGHFGYPHLSNSDAYVQGKEILEASAGMSFWEEQGAHPYAGGCLKLQKAASWFDYSLRGRLSKEEFDEIDSAKPFCISQGKDTEHLSHSWVEGVGPKGQRFDIPSETYDLTAGGSLSPVKAIPLGRAGAQGAGLAGAPTLRVSVENNTLPIECLEDRQPGCDSIVFVAPGVLREGEWKVLHDQVTPIRGVGFHDLNLNVIGFTVKPGEEVGLLLMAKHNNFHLSFSTDQAVPQIEVQGQMDWPVVSGSLQPNHEPTPSYDHVSELEWNISSSVGLSVLDIKASSETVIAVVGGQSAGFIRRSTDGGKTWGVPVTKSPERTYRYYALATNDNGTWIASGYPRSYAISVDDGLTWAVRKFPRAYNYVRSLQFDGDDFLAFDGKTFMKSQSGWNWSAVSMPFWSPSIGGNLLTQNKTSLFSSKGAILRVPKDELPSLISVEKNVSLQDMSGSESGLLVAVGDKNRIFVSHDDGLTWARVPSPPVSSDFNWTAVSVGPQGGWIVAGREKPSNVSVFVPTKTKVFSTNDFTHWKEQSSLAVNLMPGSLELVDETILFGGALIMRGSRSN